MNPRQGDLFLYGTESLICPINRKGSWVGCLGWQRGWARTFFLSNFFPFQPFSFISDKNRLMNVPNSYFFLNIFKNRLKWIKDPNLHDSRLRYMQYTLSFVWQQFPGTQDGTRVKKSFRGPKQAAPHLQLPKLPTNSFLLQIGKNAGPR